MEGNQIDALGNKQSQEDHTDQVQNNAGQGQD